jgi:hypothetical protein
MRFSLTLLRFRIGFEYAWHFVSYLSAFDLLFCLTCLGTGMVFVVVFQFSTSKLADEN